MYNENLQGYIWKYYGECVYLGGGETMSKEKYIRDNITKLSYTEIKEVVEQDCYIPPSD